MTDDTRTEDVAATEDQPGAMSTPDQETTQSDTADEVALSEVPESGVVEDNELPDGVKDRTAEQFDKLRGQLRSERLRRQQAEELASQLQFSGFGNFTQPQVSDRPLYDAQTGYVDVSELEKMRDTTKRAQQRAERSEKKLEEFIQTQQEREAYTSYPELNMEDKSFDQDFYNVVRGVLTDSIVNPKDYGGRELSLREAADKVRGMSGKELAKAEQLGAERAVKKLTPKEQASLEASGRSDRRTPDVDYNDLRNRSRRGDRAAVIERLRRLR